MVEQTTILFLVSEESDNFNESIVKIEELLEKNCNLIIISLSVLTSIELKKRNIRYKTPNNYFADCNYEELDEISLKFAQNWYSSLDEHVVYRGVSLGQMLEYDFYFLFVDVLRSFNIAENILLHENPCMIYLPQNLTLTDPNFTCYETLPNVLKNLANRTIKIKVICSSNLKDSNRKNSFQFDLKDKIFYLYTKLVNFYQMHFLSFFHPKVIMFWNVYSYNSISKNLKKKGYFSTKVYPTKINNKFTKRKIEKINFLFAELKKNNYSNLQLTYKGHDLTLILKNHFEEAFYKFQELIQYLEWVEQISEKFLQCEIVLMEDITSVKRALIKLFKIKKVSSLVIQHGLVDKDMSGFGAMPIEANNQAIWGDDTLQWHLRHGNKSQIITGNPVFDMIPRYKKEFQREKIFSKLGLNAEKKTILITTERFAGTTSKYTIEDEERKIRGAIKSLKNFKDMQKIVKLHPGHQDKYGRIISNIANEQDIDLVMFSDSYWELISICDVLITFTSTTGLEAMLFGKPIIAIGAEEEVKSYVSRVLAKGVFELNKIETDLKEILDGNWEYQSKILNSYIYKNCYLIDGRSSERVADLIVSQLNDA